jgi:hypothetical protein
MFTNLKKVVISFFKSLLINRRLNTYIFFFAIAFAFWFLTMLSKTHETTFLMPIKYVNHPPNLIEIVDPAKFIKVRVKASGISIISFHLFNKNSIVLNYDVANSQPIENGRNLFWTINSNRKEVARILGYSVEIMNITPERIIVSFANKIQKVVPVILNANISLRQAFWLANDIIIKPSSIILYGEQKLLDSVNSITTDLLDLNDVYKDQLYHVDLRTPNGLKCMYTTISVELKVEPFIEEVITKEVEIRNLKKGYSMKLFPKDVSVTLRLPKDKYHFLKVGFLKLFVDASKLDDKETAAVEYDNLPEIVKIERIYPNRLEFLLIKE